MLLRSGIVVAGLTLLSRIFGLARELFIAYSFGAGSVADGVNIAFKLPNLFRRIFGEGALAAIFIPIFNQKMLSSKEEACKISGEIFTLLILVLVALVTILEIFMPSLMFILAPGFYTDPSQYELATLLCRITLPYVIFISATALFGSMLNSLRKFAAFAFTPVILSICVIIGTLMLKQYISAPIAVALSILVAGVMQLLFIFLCIKKAKLAIPLGVNLHDPDIKHFLSNMLPATISNGVYQLNLFLSQSIASFIPGAISILGYADRIYQFPLSIIGVSFGTILLPELSRAYKNHDHKLAHTIQDKAIKLGFALALPASFGIILLAHPIIHIIYEHGAFDSTDTIKTANTISIFALGLPSFVLSKILTPIFYANSDTKTPLNITLYSLLVNCSLNLLLMIKFSYLGIAIGSTIASWLEVLLLYVYAKRRGFGLKINKELIWFIFKILLACFIMSAFVLLYNYYYSDYYYSNMLVIKMTTLGLVITFAAILFCLCAFLLRLTNQLANK